MSGREATAGIDVVIDVDMVTVGLTCIDDGLFVAIEDACCCVCRIPLVSVVAISNATCGEDCCEPPEARLALRVAVAVVLVGVGGPMKRRYGKMISMMEMIVIIMQIMMMILSLYAPLTIRWL